MNQKPIREYQGRLNVFEDRAFIFVECDTFKYGFSKKSGLISRLEVLGNDFLKGTDSEIPDIYVSDAINPRESPYAAKYEDEAECDIISANPYEVHIRTHGAYRNSAGDTFPIRYRITYEIQCDGTIFIIVDNKANDPCVIRWLCVSRGVLASSLCRYFSHLADQSKIDTTENYTFKKTPSGKERDQLLFSGRFIPWFWFGNDRAGVEICVWDAAHHRHGVTLVGGKAIDPIGEAGANVSGIAQSSGILWEVFSIRNVQTPVNSRWEQTNYFALSVTPPKSYRPGFAGLRVYRCDAPYEYPSDDEIKELSHRGYNLIIGGANWRPGEYVSDNESETKRVTSTCHRYGMKIIPRVSLMDLCEDTETFKEYGSEWRIEPAVEYEYETSLMCPGAEGWREYWKQQIDRIVENYDFDGFYIDLRYDRLACRNPRHGCQRQYVRSTFVWARDMLRYACAKTKAKDPGSIIIANTDLIPVSMICNRVDVRSIGASQDIRHIDRMTGKAFYSSYRLGCNSLMRTDRVQKIDPRVISLSLVYMAPPILNRGHSKEEIDLTMLYWNIYRAFGIGESIWYPGFVDDHGKVVVASNPDLYVNVHKRGSLLLTLVNLSPDEVQADVSILDFAELGLRDDKKYLVYEPVSRRFLENGKQWNCRDLRNFPVTVPGNSPLLLYIRECPASPVLLFAPGSDKVLEERWDEETGTLRFSLAAPLGADVSLVIYSPSGKLSQITAAGREMQFTWDESQNLAFSDIQTGDATTSVEVKTSHGK